MSVDVRRQRQRDPGAFLDRDVFAGRRGHPDGGVEDRVEDEFDTESAATGRAGSGPSVVDQFHILEDADPVIFDEFEFPRRSFDRFGPRRRFGYAGGQVPDQRRTGRPDVAAAAKQRVEVSIKVDLHPQPDPLVYKRVNVFEIMLEKMLPQKR